MQPSACSPVGVLSICIPRHHMTILGFWVPWTPRDMICRSLAPLGSADMLRLCSGGERDQWSIFSVKRQRGSFRSAAG